MSNLTTQLSDLINPQVMGDMVSAKIPNKIVVSPFAKVDSSLVGVAGNTITVPTYSYIGDAVDVAEGVLAETVKLSASSTQVTVKKAMKAVEITDEAILSGFGDPVGQANNQLAKAIASKIDNDAMNSLYNAQLFFESPTSVISYNTIVDAIDKFNEEMNTEKVMFVHPNQVTTLRKDPNFIGADKYSLNTLMTGEIGMIANTRIVPSKKVQLLSVWYSPCDSSTAGALTIVAGGTTPTATQVLISDVVKSLPNAIVGQTVLKNTSSVYFNPIVKLTQDDETEEEVPAITIYLKRDINLEADRVSLARKTDVSVDEHYAVALSDSSKVVLAKIKQK